MNKNKTMAIAVSLILTFAMAISLVAIPAANAHDPPWSIPTYAFINVAPNPAGLGQTVTVAFWPNFVPPTATGPYGDRWMGMTVKVTKPDGTTETFGPFTSDATGGAFMLYTPNTLGNYTFQMSFPGQTIAGNNLSPTTSSTVKAYIGDQVQPSNSKICTLTVQQEPIPSVPLTPLPTEYWTRPINAENVNLWYAIAGNWLGFGASFSGNTGMYSQSGNYNPYTTAPTTAHIMWTKPEAFGGALGGEFGGDLTSHYYSTRQYERMFSPIIINGILYYTMYPGSSTNPAGWAAVDLHTGETLWTTNTPLTAPATTFSLGNGTTLSVANGDFNTVSTQGAPTVLRCGQILKYVSPNQYGGLAYLWSTGTPTMVAAATNIAPGTTTWNMFDAMTGTYILSIVNGSAIWPLTQDAQGDLIGYFVDRTDPNAPTLNKWNSTQCIPIAAAGWMWRPPQGAILPFKTGIMWSKPIATNISGVPLPPLQASRYSCFGVDSGVAVLTWMDAAGLDTPTTYTIEAGYSTDTGEQLWITNRTQTPFARLDTPGSSIWMGSGVYVECTLPTNTLVGYSVTTGKELWTTVLPDANPYDAIGQYESGQVANGTLYTWGLGGDIWAVDMLTGKILWYTNTVTLHGEAGTNTPYGVWPIWTFSTGTIADGILFLPEGHEYSPPLFHGAQQLAINITNGQLVWRILSFNTINAPAIADGIMTVANAYDNQIYAYGKGPSATTVTAAPEISVHGNNVLVKGTVMDISAGTKQEEQAARFPNGVPAIADANMSAWMEYVYMQQSRPTDVKGVEVVLEVLDPNNNYYEVGRATSDASGFYSVAFTPEVPGKYTIIATFKGSESYWPSYAETAINVEEAPAATPAPTPTPAPMTDTYVLGIGSAILIAVIIGFVVLILIFRKR